VDLLVVNLNAPAILLRNDGGNKNNWLTVALKLSNEKTDAIGARVTVLNDGRRQVRDVVGVMGYLSQGDLRAHFGLGSAKKVDVIEIRWPDGRVQKLTDVGANQILTVVQKAR
jgi:hypothetical protein